MNSIFKEHKKYIFAFILATAICSLLAISNIEKLFGHQADTRVVLSSLIFTPREYPEDKYYVFKILQKNIISIEIYRPKPDGDFELISHFETNTKYDGYFLLGGNATNFAYVNPTEGEAAQIISPGFDKNLIAYLNVIQYNPMTKGFTLLGTSAFQNNQF